MLWLLDNGHIMEQRPSPKKSNYTGNISDDTQAFPEVIWMGCTFFCTDKHFSLLNFFELSVLRVSAQKNALTTVPCSTIKDVSQKAVLCKCPDVLTRKLSCLWWQSCPSGTNATFLFMYVLICTDITRPFENIKPTYFGSWWSISYLPTFCFVHLPKSSSASWMK